MNKFKKLKKIRDINKWKGLINRTCLRLSDPNIPLNFLQKMKPLHKRIYRVNDPVSGKILYSPTLLQRQAFFRTLHYRKDFFVAVAEIVKELDASIILDVGANIGYTTRAFSTYDQNLEIISIEPDISNIAFTAKNVNDLPNVSIFHMGLGNDFGRFDVALPDYTKARKGEKKHNTGLFSAIDNQSENGTRFTRGDDLINFLRIKPKDIGWIKIDVEGFENNVLQGFNSVLSSTQSVVEVEINPRTIRLAKSNLSEILTFMDKYSYKPLINNEVTDDYIKNLKVFDIYFVKEIKSSYISKKLNFVDLNTSQFDLASLV